MSSDPAELRVPTRPPTDAAKTTFAEFALIVGVAVIAAIGLTMWFRKQAETMTEPRGGLAVGKLAPAVTAPRWINGEPTDLEGRVRVVHAWFATCPACVHEAPSLVKLEKKYRDRVVFVGLTPDSPKEDELVEGFLARTGFSWPNGQYAIESLLGFEAEYFPGVWVVGRDGVVLWNRDLEESETLEEAIERALAAG